MASTKGEWQTPPGQTLAESSGELVHFDVQGFAPILPDAHSTNFPVLSFPPSSTTEQTASRQAATVPSIPSRFATFEIFVHRLFALTSVPINLLLPPYSDVRVLHQPPTQTARIGKIALHPDLPIIALAHAHPGGSIFLFDLRTNAYLKYKLSLTNTQQLNSMTFSKYNHLAAGMSNGEVLIYDLNLALNSSAGSKTPHPSAIPSFATLIPPQLPVSALLGEITDLSFDYSSARYLAISTTRSGTWIYDTVYSSSLRLSRHPAALVAFSPSQNVLAIALERTGDIELYTMIRAGTLMFSLPSTAKSGFKTTVTQMCWSFDGKSLLYCNAGQEGIRIMKVDALDIVPPTAQYLGNIMTPLRATTPEGVPFGGIPDNFAFDRTSKRLVVSYTKSPLLEVFGFSNFGDSVDATALGLIRGPTAGARTISDKARGKKPEGQSPFEEDLWERTNCSDMGFVGQALGAKGSLFAGAWNGEEGGKIAFVAFYLDDISI